MYCNIFSMENVRIFHTTLQSNRSTFPQFLPQDDQIYFLQAAANPLAIWGPPHTNCAFHELVRHTELFDHWNTVIQRYEVLQSLSYHAAAERQWVLRFIRTFRSTGVLDSEFINYMSYFRAAWSVHNTKILSKKYLQKC